MGCAGTREEATREPYFMASVEAVRARIHRGRQYAPEQSCRLSLLQMRVDLNINDCGDSPAAWPMSPNVLIAQIASAQRGGSFIHTRLSALIGLRQRPRLEGVRALLGSELLLGDFNGRVESVMGR
jgi:hypothetical protein